MVTRVLADVRAFAAGAKQSDDITLLAVAVPPLDRVTLDSARGRLDYAWAR